ncbi:MAG: putative Zn finger protein [Chlamydiales bacterium]|jgi:uncharacterized Zn finger protein
MKERIANTKMYLATCKKENIPPTIRGIFDAQYPKMAVFMHVASRFVENPGQFLALEVSGGRLQERKLKHFIEDAIANEAATEKEVSEMEENLAFLQESSFPKHFVKFMIA